MKRKAKPSPVETRDAHQISQELTDYLLDLIRSKFYPSSCPGAGVTFAKDLPRLKSWVVWWPAKWLRERGIPFAPDRFKAIMTKCLLDAQMMGSENIAYLPGWLHTVVKRHWSYNEDVYYAEGKDLRNEVDRVMKTLGPLVATQRAPDWQADMLAATKLLKAKKTVPVKAPVKDQLSLF
jgi:hypothetical protein